MNDDRPHWRKFKEEIEESNKKIFKSDCPECSHRLYTTILKSWPDTSSAILKKSFDLDKPTMMHKTVLVSQLKEFNATLMELTEFAALVCGVEASKFSRLDMLNYLFENMNRFKKVKDE